ncbi:MAG: oxidoreductase [Halieaceae bacterium]|nr:oxidoreductase [Halieaceae bacterium]
MAWGFNDMPDQTGKLAVITGANSGIGYETARMLAAKNATVILACRNEMKGNEALLKIKEEYPEAEVKVELLDTSSLSSVRGFAKRFYDQYSKLDLLINNAGIFGGSTSITDDGLELHMATNYFGHFCLAGLLLNGLEAAGNARVIALSSQSHRGATIDFSTLNSDEKITPIKRYAKTKLAILIFSFELQRRLEEAGSSVISLAANPGTTSSALGKDSLLLDFLLNSKFATWIGISHSSEAGAVITLRAATDPDARGSIFYGPSGGGRNLTGPPELEEPSPKALDQSVAEKLWQVSEELTGIRYLSS